MSVLFNFLSHSLAFSRSFSNSLVILSVVNLYYITVSVIVMRPCVGIITNFLRSFKPCFHDISNALFLRLVIVRFNNVSHRTFCPFQLSSHPKPIYLILTYFLGPPFLLCSSSPIAHSLSLPPAPHFPLSSPPLSNSSTSLSLLPLSLSLFKFKARRSTQT